MPEFRMPSLGADMDEGTLLEWLVKPGDQVHKGDIVAVVDTAKAAVEVECFDDGVVEALLVEPGITVPVGAPLAIITGAKAPSTPEPRMEPLKASGTPEEVAEPSTQPPLTPAAPPPSIPTPAEPRVSSPLVRHLADERGIDLASVRGTGRNGTIIRADIERAARAGVERAAPADTRLRASPLARRLATELDIDLREVTATGTSGAVRAEDVRRAATARDQAGPAPRPAVPPEAKKRSATGRQAAMRQTIGRLMARSKREIPHYYLSTTIDMAAAMNWLRARNRELAVPQRLLPAALLLKASALAAREVPRLNGYWTDEEFIPGEAVHLGVAVSLRGGGLVTPALRDAPDLSLTDLMAALKDLVVRARGGRLRGSELTDATITVTNLGDQGVESVTGVIYPPQVALIGFGKVLDRPWAVDGLLGVRPVVTATLAADHRATDGYTGARLLEAVDRLLQHPEEL